MKVNDEAAAAELPLNDEPTPAKKMPRDVVVALKHISKRRDKALADRRKLDEEIEGLDAAIEALG